MRNLVFCSVMLFAPTTAWAAENWYSCTHFEWKEAFGFSNIVVPESLIEEYGEGPDVTCDLLGSDRASSIAKACAIQANSDKITMSEFDDSGTALMSLGC